MKPYKQTVRIPYTASTGYFAVKRQVISKPFSAVAPAERPMTRLTAPEATPKTRNNG